MDLGLILSSHMHFKRNLDNIKYLTNHDSKMMACKILIKAEVNDLEIS